MPVKTVNNQRNHPTKPGIDHVHQIRQTHQIRKSVHRNRRPRSQGFQSRPLCEGSGTTSEEGGSAHQPTQLVTDEAEPKYTLLSQSSALDAEINSLRMEIENLQRVLGPVMVGESKGGDVFDFPQSRLSSVLGTQLDQMQVLVRHLSIHVRSLADRVELV